jgi:hypothetical protein
VAQAGHCAAGLSHDAYAPAATHETVSREVLFRRQAQRRYRVDAQRRALNLGYFISGYTQEDHYMIPLSLPLSLPLWELAAFQATRPEMRALLGAPHFIETDSTRTAGGEEDSWAFLLPSGQRILIILEVPYSNVQIIADPPEITQVLQSLGISPEDSRLNCYLTPVPLK